MTSLAVGLPSTPAVDGAPTRHGGGDGAGNEPTSSATAAVGGAVAASVVDCADAGADVTVDALQRPVVRRLKARFPAPVRRDKRRASARLYWLLSDAEASEVAAVGVACGATAAAESAVPGGVSGGTSSAAHAVTKPASGRGQGLFSGGRMGHLRHVRAGPTPDSYAPSQTSSAPSQEHTQHSADRELDLTLRGHARIRLLGLARVGWRLPYGADRRSASLAQVLVTTLSKAREFDGGSATAVVASHGARH